MLKNYLLTAFRNIIREKLFTIMNIAGLALGIGCAMVIYKIITYEQSYDKHHSNYDNIYRILRERAKANGPVYSESVPHPLGSALRNDFPDIKVSLTHYEPEGQVNIERADGNIDKFDLTNSVVYAEPSVFEIFDFEFLAGDKNTCLNNTGNVVITTDLAKQYFGLEKNQASDVIGKSLILNNEVNLTVTAVISNPPNNTDVPFKLFVYYQDLEKTDAYYHEGKNWFSNSSSTNCYVLLPKALDGKAFENQLINFWDKNVGALNETRVEKYVVQPLAELHSSDTFQNYNDHQVTRKMLLALTIIGIFLIVTASINFVNLATAQAVKRAKEIGVRKTLGGSRKQLVIQFLSETIFIALIASLFGLLISELLFVYLEDLIGYKLALDLISKPDGLMFLLGLTFGVGILSGLYPAFIMAKMNPVMALKNSLSSKSKSGFLSLRRVLVIFQFSISQVLIIGTIVVGSQIDYFLTKDLGFNKDSILVAYLPENDKSKLDVLKNKLIANSNIEKVSFSLSSPLGDNTASTRFNHSSLSNDDEYQISLKIADEDYLDLFQLKLIAGRNYTKSDTAVNGVINRKLTKLIGFDNPQDALGETIKTGWSMDFKVIGVVEDFHSTSFDEEMPYIALVKIPSVYYEMAVKFNANGAGISDINEVINSTKEAWNAAFPNFIFNYDFNDKQIKKRFENEQNMANLFQLFALIAIFIGCLGLYGLISYVANQKTKEIGVRKVLGASVMNIVSIFSKEMFYLILIAFALAGPIGYYFMNIWLDEYVYRITLSPVVFVLAIAISLTIGLFTVAYKSIAASLANPVLSLKDE